MESASAELNNVFADGYLRLYDEIENDAVTAMTDVQSPVRNFSFDPDSIRHWQYWITLDTILRVALNPRTHSDCSYR